MISTQTMAGALAANTDSFDLHIITQKRDVTDCWILSNKACMAYLNHKHKQSYFKFMLPDGLKDQQHSEGAGVRVRLIITGEVFTIVSPKAKIDQFSELVTDCWKRLLKGKFGRQDCQVETNRNSMGLHMMTGAPVVELKHAQFQHRRMDLWRNIKRCCMTIQIK